MPLLHIVGLILLVGLICFGIDAVPWIKAEFKRLAIVLICVVFGAWLIGLLFGVNLGTIRIGR